MVKKLTGNFVNKKNSNYKKNLKEKNYKLNLIREKKSFKKEKFSFKKIWKLKNKNIKI